MPMRRYFVTRGKFSTDSEKSGFTRISRKNSHLHAGGKRIWSRLIFHIGIRGCQHHMHGSGARNGSQTWHRASRRFSINESRPGQRSRKKNHHFIFHKLPPVPIISMLPLGRSSPVWCQAPSTGLVPGTFPWQSYLV